MPFRARFATAAARGGAVVLVHMEPWHQSLAAIAAGDSDTYLTGSPAVRRYGGQVIMSFAPEADGGWYPWGWHHAEPAQGAAWRHVVTLFRQSGAINVTWLWDMSGDSRATGTGPELVAGPPVRGLGRRRWLLRHTGQHVQERLRRYRADTSGSSPRSRCCSRRSASGRSPGRPGRFPACSPVSAATACWAWSTSTSPSTMVCITRTGGWTTTPQPSQRSVPG